jgi:hypothetical protein
MQRSTFDTHTSHRRIPLTPGLNTTQASPNPHSVLSTHVVGRGLVIEPVLTQPIRQADPWHADDLARQMPSHSPFSAVDVTTPPRTPHTTTAPQQPLCTLPARPLSGRAALSISLRSQPRVVYIRCIGSRRPPLTQQRSPPASSTGLLTRLPSTRYQESEATLIPDLHEPKQLDIGAMKVCTHCDRR